MFIKSFEKYSEYLEESYLKGGRAPLYHFTYRLIDILSDDTLKTARSVGYSNGKENAISFTRNADYNEYNKAYRLELDTDALIKDGYKPFSVDELGWAAIKRGKKDNFVKSNIDSFRKGVRGTRHNIKSLPDVGDVELETEFEERIFRNIENLGKYLLSISIYKDIHSNIYNIINKYLKKYPHIKIYLYGKDIRKQTEITDKVRNIQKDKVLESDEKDKSFDFEKEETDNLSPDIDSLGDQMADDVNKSKVTGEWEIEKIIDVSTNEPSDEIKESAIIINAELGDKKVKRGDFIYITALINKRGSSRVHHSQMGVIKTRVVEIYNSLLVLNNIRK